jgi:hypothetical protein
VEQHGISPQLISGSIGYNLRGTNLSKYHTDEGREVNIWLQLKKQGRQNLSDLRSLPSPLQMAARSRWNPLPVPMWSAPRAASVVKTDRPYSM